MTRGAGVAVCVIVAMIFAATVLAQNDIPAKTMKDLAQDGAISQIQTQDGTMQREIHGLLTGETHLEIEQSHDEGIAIGAFLVLSFLQGAGLLMEWISRSERRRREEMGDE